MKNPRDYNKALYFCQVFSMAFYVTVSVVLWRYAGVYIANPALGSAGPLIKKIAYGSQSTFPFQTLHPSSHSLRTFFR
jgi:hypothetical protein